MKKQRFNSVEEELLFLAEQNGGLINPHQALEFSRDPETHLHHKLEWNNEKAGNKWRLHQIRNIIRLKLPVIEKKDGEFQIRTDLNLSFVSLKEDRKSDGGYRVLKNVLSDDVRRETFKEEAFKDLIIWHNKYKLVCALVEEFTPIFSEIDKLISKQNISRPRQSDDRVQP